MVKYLSLHVCVCIYIYIKEMGLIRESRIVLVVEAFNGTDIGANNGELRGLVGSLGIMRKKQRFFQWRRRDSSRLRWCTSWWWRRWWSPSLHTYLYIIIILDLFSLSHLSISLSLSLKHYSHFIPFFSPVPWRSNGKLRIVCLFFVVKCFVGFWPFWKGFTFNIQRTWEFCVLFLLFLGCGLFF